MSIVTIYILHEYCNDIYFISIVQYSPCKNPRVRSCLLDHPFVEDDQFWNSTHLDLKNKRKGLI